MANDVNCDQLCSYNNKVLYMQVNKLKWLRAIHMYGFTIKIKMLILAKVLSIVFLKESVFTSICFPFTPANQSIQLFVKGKLEVQGV